MKNRIIIGIIVSLMVACSPIKQGYSKSIPNKLFESFYLGDKGNRYFIKPLLFKGKEKNKLLMDFTFLQTPKKELKDSITVNFSIIFDRKKDLREIEKAKFNSFNSGAIKVLFEESNTLRLSTKLSSNTFKKFMASSKHEVIVGGTLKEERFKSNSSTQKKMNKLTTFFEF